MTSRCSQPGLPFGLRSPPKIFNAIVDALNWHWSTPAPCRQTWTPVSPSMQMGRSQDPLPQGAGIVGSHACKVVRSGRSFLRRMRHVVHHPKYSNTLIHLNKSFHSNLASPGDLTLPPPPPNHMSRAGRSLQMLLWIIHSIGTNPHLIGTPAWGEACTAARSSAIEIARTPGRA